MTDSITLREYTKLAKKTAGTHFEHPTLGLCNWAMGLAGEVGELLDYLKKVYFHGHQRDRDREVKELGDIYWYLAILSDWLGIGSDEILRVNIDKLSKRYEGGFSSESSVRRADLETPEPVDNLGEGSGRRHTKV